ncbi:hypothetical protein [Nocardia sp. NPDC046763]|uniref:hypothetical protein n=1 Tax=Nocardia sp. NPDC046763 TaxID=3155256 RepID=UPI0033E1E9B0
MGMTSVTARELTEQIKASAEDLWQLIAQAYLDRVWEVLSYSSWDEYCAKEFGSCRLQLPREDRQEVVASMREIGMSQRAIAAAIGLSKGTVQNDLAASGQFCPPEPVLSSDTKTQQPESIDNAAVLAKPQPETRRRRPIAEAFDVARYDLLKRAESLVRLAADDRFDRNADQLAHRYRFDLIQARDAIQAVLDRLPEPTTDSRKE